MTTESETKKPPAHEVIVHALNKQARAWLIEVDARRSGKRNNVGRVEACAKVLIDVLIQMHIPHDARAAVMREVRQLPDAFTRTLPKNLSEIIGNRGGA